MSTCQFAQVKAQTFAGLPGNINWQSINNDTLRVLFPEGLEDQAQHVAAIIHRLRADSSFQLGDRVKKIDLVLQNQTSVTNGFVSLSPWKSYFNLTPFQNSFILGSTPWLDLLSVHEYRHAVQVSNFRRGITNLLYLIAGERVWSGMLNVVVPDWFLEGDAVWAESKWTPMGRAQIPEFLRGVRAIEDAGIRYSYQKYRNGSIKDFIPNHYRLGYLMVDYIRDEYSDDVWKGVLQDAGRFKHVIYPFSNALKERTGENTKDLYQKAFDRYQNEYRRHRKKEDEFLPITHNVFTQYQFPQKWMDNIVYYKSSFEKIGAFYKWTGKSEIKIVNKGNAISDYFSVGRNFLLWTEWSTDPLRNSKDFNDIIVYDILRNRKYSITKQSRYFSPALHPVKDLIAAIHIDNMGKTQLHLLNTAGKITNESEMEHVVLSYPKWSEDGSSLFLTARNQSGSGILQFHIQNQEVDTLLEFANRNIGPLQINEDKLYFGASDGLVENIFQMDLTTGSINRITDSQNGAFQPFLDKDTLYYTSFTHLGNRIFYKDIQKVETFERVDQSLYEVAHSGQPEIFNSREIRKVTPYRDLLHLFNFHSWYFQYDNDILTAQIESRNVLNTMLINGGVRYYNNTELWQPFVNWRIGGVPGVEFEYNSLKRQFSNQDTILNWREHNINIGPYINLFLNKGLHNSKIFSRLTFEQTLARGDVDLELPSLRFNFFVDRLRLKARKNLFTHDGQYFNLSFRNSLNDLKASQITLATAIALPGFFVNHNFIFEADFINNLSEEEGSDYQFGNNIRMPRGYAFWGRGFHQANRFSLNYHIPIFYPDWGIGGMIYFYRVRANFFGDVGQAHFNDFMINNRSAGLEIVFDTRVLNTEDITFGIRYNYGSFGGLKRSNVEFFVPSYRF